MAGKGEKEERQLDLSWKQIWTEKESKRIKFNRKQSKAIKENVNHLIKIKIRKQRKAVSGN